jgi:hypothetical protein
MVTPTTMAFGTRARSMGRDCTTVKSRSMRESGKMANALEELTMIAK